MDRGRSLRRARATPTTTSSARQCRARRQATTCRCGSRAAVRPATRSPSRSTSSPKDVLILAADDYTGHLQLPGLSGRRRPARLSLTLRQTPSTRRRTPSTSYDVDARGRSRRTTWACSVTTTPWCGTRATICSPVNPAQPGGTGAATLANNEMLELRAYLNEGGRLLYTGRSAGWQYANAFDYNPVSTPPVCDNVDQSVDDGCLLLSDDFLQYWLGAYLFIEDGGTDPRPVNRSRSPATPGRRSTDSTGRSTAVTAPTTTTRTPRVARPSRSSPRPACSSRTSSHSSLATRSRRGRPVWPGRSARTPAATTSTRTDRTSRTSA